MEKMALEPLRAIIGQLPKRLLFSRLPSDAGAEEVARGLDFHRSPDSHYHRELHLVLQGEQVFRVGGKVFMMRSGDALFIDRWEEHGHTTPPSSKAGDLPYVCAILHGHEPMWWHIVRETRPGTFVLVSDETHVILSDSLSAFFKRHVDAASVCADTHKMAVRLATAVNAAVAEYALALEEAAPGGASRGMSLEMVRRRIAETHGARCTVKNLAALAGLTQQTLERRFRAAYGRSVRNEIQRVREEYVHMAVVCGESQKEIAAALGFSAVSNYSRWLRSHSRRSNQLEDIVRTYIDHSHGANCSLSELAARFGYSVSRLVHIYKERTGESIGDAVRRARCEFVRAHPGLPDAKMAKALGFQSVAAYHRFRR